MAANPVNSDLSHVPPATDPERFDKAGKAARAYLVAAAWESVQYVALGNVLKRDLMERFRLNAREAEVQLAAICNDLTEKIKRL